MKSDPTAVPKSIVVAVIIVGTICLGSFAAQMVLSRDHKTSFLRLAIWSCCYVAIGFGLIKRVKLAFWLGLILSVSQTLPMIMSWSASVRRYIGPMPSWFGFTFYISAALGVALLISLLVKSSRDYMFTEES